MSSLWPAVCELMLRIRQNGLLGVETPSLNTSLSSHVMCERKLACACVFMLVCVGTEECASVQAVDQIHQLEISSAFLSSVFFSVSNPAQLPCLNFLLCFSLITFYFSLHHFVTQSCSQLFLIIGSFSNHRGPGPCATSRCPSCH